jgi:hypothetical protein
MVPNHDAHSITCGAITNSAKFWYDRTTATVSTVRHSNGPCPCLHAGPVLSLVQSTIIYLSAQSPNSESHINMAILSSFSLVITASCGFAVSYFLTLLFKARSNFYHNYVKQGHPMPPWNPILGHLLVLDKTFKNHNLPRDMHMNDVFAPISKDFDHSDSLFYVDLWPFLKPTVLVSSPKYAQQAELVLDRPDALLWSMHPVTGGPSVFATNGKEWKDTRNLLLPGFKSNYISNQTIYATNEAERLVEDLRAKAQNRDIFQLDHVILKYMMKISGASTLYGAAQELYLFTTPIN